MAAPAFFSTEWADAVREAVNTKRAPEYEATKLPLYWNWVDLVGAEISSTLALAVTDGPGNGARPRYLALDYEAGTCTVARPVEESQVQDARWILSGRYDDWKLIMGGYDTNKAVMYRKLRLAKGDVFDFFNRVYFFIEALANLAKVPTSFPD